MPIPSPSMMSSGSGFLTGAGNAFGYGAATAGAQLLSQHVLGNGSVNFRGKYARNKLAHDKEIWRQQQAHHLSTIRPNQAELMKSLDDSGLHRLAALGMTPGQGSTSSSSQPMIPGGNADFGSAVGKGINTAMSVSMNREARENARHLAGLQVEEQGLRNDWLRTQIATSELALQKEATNTQRPPIPLTPHSSEMRHREYLSSNNKTVKARPGTTAEDLEREINDWAQWMPSVMGRAWDMFKQDFRNSYNLEDWPSKYRNFGKKNTYENRPLMNPAPGSQRRNPRYR